MKDKTPDPTGQKPVGEQQRPGPDKTMETEFQARKQQKGRLSREDQRRLGDVLQRVYDDVVHQGVPDRFKTLIDQISSNDAAEADDEGAGRTHTASDNSGPMHGVQAKGSDKSKDEN